LKELVAASLRPLIDARTVAVFVHERRICDEADCETVQEVMEPVSHLMRARVSRDRDFFGVSCGCIVEDGIIQMLFV
jgi:hypothetical protein